MSKSEQAKGARNIIGIGRHKGNSLSVAKKMTNRQRRRLEKKDPENAPTKTAYRGWLA